MAGEKQFGTFIVSYREFWHYGSFESSKTRPVRYLYEKRKRVSTVLASEGAKKGDLPFDKSKLLQELIIQSVNN